MAVNPKSPKYGSNPGTIVYGRPGSGSPAVSSLPTVGQPEITPTPTLTPPPATPLTGSFGTANTQIDEAKAGLLSAMARGGTQGAQAYQQARQQINGQQADALTLARNGTIQAPGLDAITANMVQGPSQQRIQALTQADANLQGDLTRSGAATQQYLGAAQAVLPIQQQQFNNQQDAISRGWDRWLQLQQMQQELAAQPSGGGGGGSGGGGSGGGSSGSDGGVALTAQGQVQNLLRGIVGAQRNDQADQLQGQADWATGLADDPELANLQAMSAIGTAPMPAAPLAGGSPRDTGQNIDQAQLTAQASQQAAPRLGTGLSGLAHLPAFLASQAQAFTPAQDHAQIDAERYAAQSQTQAMNYEASPEYLAERAARAQRLAAVNDQAKQLVAQIGNIAGPGYRHTGQIGAGGNQIADLLNAPIGTNDALGALDLARNSGYDLGKWGEPGIVAGMFPNESPYQAQQRSNNVLGEQIQNYQQLGQLGQQDALGGVYGTSDPYALGAAQALAPFQAKETQAQTAAAAEAAKQQTALAAASEQQVIDDALNEALPYVADGSVDPDTAKTNLFNHLVNDLGLAPATAAAAVAKVAGQIDAVASGPVAGG